MTEEEISAPIYRDEEAARLYVEALRWPDGPYCPRCGETEEIRRLAGKSHPAGIHSCRRCRRKFSVRNGSPYEHSHIPLHKWLAAAHLMSASTGMNAYKLHRVLGLTYKTTLAMTRRIRGWTQEDDGEPMDAKAKAPELHRNLKGRATSRRLPLLPRAERTTLQDRVYQMLKRSIMSGVLAPGEAVSIRSLASALGTSPIPVREALRHLTAERAVVILPNGSVSVPTMTRARFEDLRRIRILVEGHASELAAQNIQPREIVRLENMYRHGEMLLRKGDGRRFRAYNRALRSLIYRATRSESLLPIIESLWLQAGPFLNLLALDHPLMRTVLGYDLASIDALKRRDGPASRQLIERDILEVSDHILQLLPD
jgi:DNA-binding GntR family transcriptional regulator/transposase-like protein